MVLSLEQNSGPHSRHHADVDDGQQDPAASAPPLFAGSGSWGLLLLGCGGGAGWRCLDSGELQEDLGRGWPKHWHWPVCHCLQAVVGLLQHLHLAQRWINQEIFRNKHPANYNHSIFIYVFQFDFELPTYMKKHPATNSLLTGHYLLNSEMSRLPTGDNDNGAKCKF